MFLAPLRIFLQKVADSARLPKNNSILLPTEKAHPTPWKLTKHHIDMSTIIYSSPIFGPVHSRRLGISLGINLMPADGKICTFDCLYCECGLNADHRPHTPRPSHLEVAHKLEEKLQEMAANGALPDTITFAGNGEPTAHPHFPEIIADTLELRNRYCPKAKVGVLSNSTFIHRPEVRQALMQIDQNILKLDTVDESYIHHLDRPTARYSLPEVLENMKLFNGRLIIQTMFLKGSYQGKNLDNTSDEYVLPWIAALKEIRPQQVMIYTIARETPISTLQKATSAELDRIANLLRTERFSVSVSY